MTKDGSDEDKKDFVDVLLQLQREKMAGFHLDRYHIKAIIFVSLYPLYLIFT